MRRRANRGDFEDWPAGSDAGHAPSRKRNLPIARLPQSPQRRPLGTIRGRMRGMHRIACIVPTIPRRSDPQQPRRMTAPLAIDPIRLEANCGPHPCNSADCAAQFAPPHLIAGGDARAVSRMPAIAPRHRTQNQARDGPKPSQYFQTLFERSQETAPDRLSKRF
jgi:hypothetical protein